MNKKFPMKTTLSALLAAFALAACGGGSDDEGDDAPPAAAEAADKYVGTWSSACEPSGGSSRNYVWTLNKAGAAAVTGNHAINTWTNATCTGTPNSVNNLSLAFTIDATGTASGKIVDKTSASVSVGGQVKLLFAIESNTMYSSAYLASPPDADGYPTLLKLDRPLMK
ncbi:hypothetical protein [Hydrogenophaga sp. 5NK40-0174]|uniref:hypothetical protein n=1 Tax=Hydrogenophaga sp. 5NK40-0174 TaxID=3127649 RepID=UPI003106C965